MIAYKKLIEYPVEIELWECYQHIVRILSEVNMIAYSALLP